MDISKITPDLEVRVLADVDDHYAHVATVDHMDGDKFIKLTRNDSDDGEHHWIPISLVERVDNEAIYLNCDSDEFYDELLDRAPSSENEDSHVA